MKLFRAVLLLGAALTIASCGEKRPEGQASSPATSPPSASTGAENYPATPEGADKFVADINADMRRMTPYNSAANWLAATYITDDTQLISAKAREEFLGWQARRIEEAKRFNGVQGIKPETARAILLLKNVSAPAP